MIYTLKHVFAWSVLLAVGGLAALAQPSRQTQPFDADWRFARFGLQPNGSRVPEPGSRSRLFTLTASSEEAGKGNVAALAMDGDPNTRWCASSGAPNQWLQLDLGAEQAVARADILWETNSPGYSSVIEASADQKTWRPLPCAARFVRVRVTGTPPGLWASIREITLTDDKGQPLENRLVQTPGAPQEPGLDDSAWRKLDVPHDWAIEGPFRDDLAGSTGKLPWRGIGWYRKHFSVPAAEAGRRVFVDFDGAMANAKVYCNGALVGEWPYGYASFRLDLTPHLKFGAENVLAVRLDTEQWGSRWYPGAGLYRHVRLVSVNPVHVAHWGVFVTTPQLTAANGVAQVAVTVEEQAGQGPVTAEVRAVLLDPKEKPVGQSEPVKLTWTGSRTAEFHVSVPQPKLWDLQTPNLYTARVTVSVKGKVVDSYDQAFGFRTIEFTHDDGFHLNGRRVPLQGVCDHHDLGALGAAVNRRALERQLEILRELGCNAIRTSHNPPAPELLELADKMGFLVMDEAFDCFLHSKDGGGNDYARLYREWHEKDLAMLVQRDRNHPSVIMWSMGNEIPEQHEPGKFYLFHENAEIIHRFDTTRPATGGISLPKETAFSGLENMLDVHGMNYAAGVYGGPDLYGKFLSFPGHEKLAGFSSESASTISSRGEYFFAGEPATPWQVSSYDLHQPGWGSLPDEEFAALDKYPAICGEFVWTGFDYLGEPTPFNSDATVLLNTYSDEKERAKLAAELERIHKTRPPSRSSYFGIVDLAGFPKDRFYLYQARWRPEHPMAHLLPHWNWPGREGKTTPVFAYTSGDEAELFLNGQSLGRKQKGKFEYRLRWNEVKYQPGELKLVAYKNGQPWATDQVKTTGAPAQLALSADRAALKNDGEDLCYLTVRVADSAGLTVPRSHPLINFSVEGPGEIVATDNGDATSFVPFQSHERAAFNGLALVIVRAKKGEQGAITVTARSEGLKEGTVKVGGGR
jgi:beta-galactosidase